MGFATAFLGDVFGLVVFMMLIAGVMKVFQIATDMREIKDALQEMRRNSQSISAPPLPGMASVRPAGGITPEELVRAVHAQRFSDDEFPVVEPTVLPPRL